MAELCERMGDWDRARELYMTLAQSSKSPAERAGHLLSLAAVLEGGYSDSPGGQRALAYASPLALGDPDRVPALDYRFGSLGSGRGYVSAGERSFQNTRVVAPPQA